MMSNREVENLREEYEHWEIEHLNEKRIKDIRLVIHHTEILISQLRDPFS
jgi:hypothetical protein